MPFETAHAYGKAGPALYRTSYPCRTFMLEWAVADGSRSLRILVGLRFFQFRLQLHYIMMHLGLDAVASIDTPTAARPGCQSSSFPCIPWKGCKLSGSCIEVRVNPHALVYCRPSGFLSHCSRHEYRAANWSKCAIAAGLCHYAVALVRTTALAVCVHACVWSYLYKAFNSARILPEVCMTSKLSLAWQTWICCCRYEFYLSGAPGVKGHRLHPLRLAGVRPPSGVDHGVDVPSQRYHELHILIPNIAELQTPCAVRTLISWLLEGIDMKSSSRKRPCTTYCLKTCCTGP